MMLVATCTRPVLVQHWRKQITRVGSVRADEVAGRGAEAWVSDFDAGGGDDMQVISSSKKAERRHEAQARTHGKAETNGREAGMNLPLGYDLNQLML